MRAFEDVGVLVTGASRGLGAAIAEAFGAEGAFVGVTYRNQEDAASGVLERIRNVGGDGVCLRLDVRDADSVKDTVSAFRERVEPAVLVNNAGIVTDRPFAMLSAEEWRNVLDTNLDGTRRMIRAVLPTMMSRRAGSIVNVASVLGLAGGAQGVAYCASKGGVVNMTRALAIDLARHDIRVNAIAPGWFETEMNDTMFSDGGGRTYMDAGSAMGRPGVDGELDGAMLYLASDASSFVNGHILEVSGGWTAT